MLSIYNLFRMNVRRYPDRKALVTAEETLTYQELSDKACEVSNYLAECGVDRGTKVGIYLKNGSAFVEAVLALFRLGGHMTLLNYRQSGHELARSVAITELDFIVTDAELRPVLVAAEEDPQYGEAVSRASIISRTWDPTRQPCAYRSCPASVVERDPAVNIFTGGTTGEPKAVCHTYGGMLAHMLETMLGSNVTGKLHDDVLLTCAPLFHIGGFEMAFEMLCSAGTVILASRLDVDAMIAMAKGNRVTQVVLIPPTIVERFRRDDAEAMEVFADVEVVVVSGGAATEETVRKIFDCFPNALIQSGCGMSERTGSLSFRYSQEEFLANPKIARSVGKPMPLSEVKLVDENGDPVPDGTPGELYGRGPCSMRGYIGQPTPFDDHGWFPTGDILYRDTDGLYYFCSRSKDMIKTGGENVYANEVENALLSHPAVAECAVVGIPDDFFGEAVAAAVVLRDGCEATEEELIAHCKERIASYKKPRKVAFMDELPKSPVGKVLKNQIKEELSK